MGDDLSALDATAQAQLVAAGECSPGELVEAAIDRIERLNPSVNAVIHRMYDKATAQAEQALPPGPFRGVPFLVKDVVCHTAGDPYHCGMRFLRDRNWTEDSDTYLATKFRAAGFVFVGKTNTPELADSITTEPLAYGPTRNPWNLEYSPAGSSGGSGAAVAAGMVPAAHGNDMGGSIRAPASACGVVGLKPSRARTSLGPDFGEFWGPLTHEGVLTRTVRDTAAILDAIAGPMPGDPYSAPPPARPFLDDVGADPGSLRIGIRPTSTHTDVPLHADCRDAVEHAGRLLERLGHHVEVSSPSALDEEGIGGAGVIFGVALARELDRWSARTGDPIGSDDVEPWTWMMAEAGRAVTGPALLATIESMQAYARRLVSWWDDYDVLVTATLGRPPIRLGVLAPDGDPNAGFGIMSELGQFTMQWNATGQPAISVPLHWTLDGLPVGVQFVAPYGREDVLVRLAAQLEQAQPWAGRRPEVFG